MKAQKWNFKKKEYESYTLPKGAVLISYNMDEVINCASCGGELFYGAGFTSKLIHTKNGLGFTVCEKCIEKEYKQQKEIKI